jgi:hypothetical protein
MVLPGIKAELISPPGLIVSPQQTLLLMVFHLTLTFFLHSPPPRLSHARDTHAAVA